jgi:hypothetical protein
MELNQIEELINGKLKEVEGKINTSGKGLNKHFDIVHILLILLAAICLTSIGWNYFKPANPVTPQIWVQPKEVKETVKIQRVAVPGPERIITIDKPVIIEKLKLPDTFKNASTVQAISSASLEPTKAGYNVIGTIDTKTGIGGMIAKEKERSFLGLPSNLSVGSRYGLITDGRQEAQVYTRYQPLRVGNVYLGLYGEANSRPEGKAMIDLEYRIKSD